MGICPNDRCRNGVSEHRGLCRECEAGMAGKEVQPAPQAMTNEVVINNGCSQSEPGPSRNVDKQVARAGSEGTCGKLIVQFSGEVNTAVEGRWECTLSTFTNVAILQKLPDHM